MRNVVMGDSLISVVITAYNIEQFIGQAIESVLAQTYRNFEIIVIDDGSQDGTAEVCRRYGHNIIYHWQNNSGVAGARNTGIRLAHGELVAMLDGDDYWYPEKLAKQVETLQQHKEADFICTDHRYLIDGKESCYTSFDRNAFVRELAVKQSGDSVILRRKDLPRFFRNPFGHTSSSLFRRALLLAVGGYDVRFSVAEDMHLWFRYLAECRSFAAIRHPLIVYRIRNGSATRNPMARGNEQSSRAYEDLLHTLKAKHPDLAAALRYQVRTARLNWIYALLREGRRHDAIQVGLKALAFGMDWRIIKVLAGAIIR
mgnify:CR=1 FL=1